MAYVSVPPYIVTDDDGSRARVRIPVSTPLALVFVDSPAPGRFIVHNGDRSGANLAIQIARSYAKTHRESFERLYLKLTAPVAAT
jgi:hypothetical protein